MIQKLRSKKGLSTVISTLLLIALALAIASIIFVSYKNIIEKEQVKADFEERCFGIEIRAEASLEGVNIINVGNVDVEGVALKNEDKEAEKVLFSEILKPGDILLINSTGESLIPIFNNGNGVYICKDKSFAVLKEM